MCGDFGEAGSSPTEAAAEDWEEDMRAAAASGRPMSLEGARGGAR